MSNAANPFKATFGTTPPLLVGRDDVIREFGFALDDGPGTHERISLVVGPRGIGKTVLLNAFEDVAVQHGWRYISETATPGFSDRIRDQIVRILLQNRKTVTGLNLAIFTLGIGLEWKDHDPRTLSSYTLREALNDLLDFQKSTDAAVGGAPTGVLITLDEMHHHLSREVFEFGAVIQHLQRENREIAVAMAGIPSSIKPLLASNSRGNEANPATFLRRANRIELGKVSDNDVRTALERPVAKSGMRWEPEALGRAVEACDGYPFMIQLVGQWAFRERSNDIITKADAERGIETARRKLGQLVHEPALADLSDVDRTFLLYMAQDDGPSRIVDIAERLGKRGSYVSNYRRRLIDAEMIAPVARGEVAFTLPYLRDYLREHAASLVADL